MYKILIDVRSSFWFVPALIALIAAALALAAIELDAGVGGDALARFPRLFGAGAEGTRQLLSAIASSTITVAGVVFSITVVALSLTATQYSPRVLRTFMRDRANHVVLGIFLGLYIYCLLVLRTIRGGEHEFVPGISTVGAIAFALVGVAFLIFFIHHVATSIQVSEIAARIASETIDAIEREYPAAGDAEPECTVDEDAEWKPVTALHTGYVQSIDYARLVREASGRRGVVRVHRGTGDFVVRGEVLAYATGGGAVDEGAAAAINAAYAINTYRDVAQDPAFGVQQLVDIALKALSPGVNDTATARTCLDYLTSMLLALVERDVRPARCIADAQDEVRVIAPRPSIEDYVAFSFEAIRRNSTQNVDMLLHALRALERVGARAAPRCRAAITREIEAVHETLAAAQYVSGDRRQLAEAIQRASATLAGDAG